MEFTLKEKLIIASKYHKYKLSSQTKSTFNGETLVILPDGDIAFEMAQLFYEKSTKKVTFLIKDSICSFYSNDIIQKSIKYTYNDMNTLGLPREIFIKVLTFGKCKVSDLKLSRFCFSNIDFFLKKGVKIKEPIINHV